MVGVRRYCIRYLLLILALVLFFCFEAKVEAQNILQQTELSSCNSGKLSPKFFQNRPWLDPLVASPHEPQMRIFFSNSKEFPYMLKKGNHSIAEVDTGKEIPIIVFDHGDNGDKPIQTGCWGFGGWMSLDLHFVLDFRDLDQPIVDTDYKVGFLSKIAYGISDDQKFGFKFKFGHESSHLAGDFTRNAQGVFGDKFEMIDVNYEYYELVASLDSTYPFGVLTQRFGVMVTADRNHKGFYTSGYVRKNGRILFPSERNTEQFIGLQYMPSWCHGFGPYVSYDGHLNTTYSYNKVVPGLKEKSRYSQTTIIGLRSCSHNGRDIPDFVFRMYTGRNPYGQLRDQNSMWAISFGMALRP